METVQKHETAKDFAVLDLDDGPVRYGGFATVYGRSDTAVIYEFDDNGKLFHGLYAFDMGNTKGGGLIRTYESTKEDLIKIYGEPIRDEIVPQTDQRSINYAGPETSIELGYTVYVAEWETEQSKIRIMLGKYNYTTFFGVDYYDINYEEDLTKSGL